MRANTLPPMPMSRRRRAAVLTRPREKLWCAARMRTRFGNAAFWSLTALSFLAGDRLGDLGNGLIVLSLALLGGFGLLGRLYETAPEAEAA